MDWKLWIVFFLLGNSTGIFIGAKYITNEVNKIGKQKVKRGTGSFTNFLDKKIGNEIQLSKRSRRRHNKRGRLRNTGK